ncbi:MAG TPA: glycosyltransferase family 2 protein [Mycobacteriales bacterium]|nr:glycosyltransferase family 2 protein [Mycobacteriales bacterium]
MMIGSVRSGFSAAGIRGHARPDRAVVRGSKRGERPQHLVPVLTVHQEAVLRLLVLAWVSSGALFWLWWFAPARGRWSVGRVASTAGLGWIFLLGAYFVFFACRIKRPNPQLTVPPLRVAMVVTKAPSEPWPMVRETLRGMVAQEVPFAYDVWLADEQPTRTARQWCRRHGVRVSTRARAPEYHQPVWPRRTKSKEGNLAYFYDRHGYDSYDVVAQLDADHVPAPGYLMEMVRPFADAGIGYVAAPSVCDANEDKGWTVRGRLHREASLHGVVQAGSNGGWAPLCIGSHYAVRTSALREVGGLGPELAEDYTTTLWLQSAGWSGAFAIDAEAHGDGPETFDDMITQELQWSRSLGTIFTRWAPSKFRTVPRRARARMSFALFFYLVQGLVCLAAISLPSLGVLTGVTWVNTSILEFYIRLSLPSLLLMSTLAWLRHCGVLRPVRAKLWSTDLVLFQLVRWPWTTWGFFQGMWAGRRSAPKPFRVTPKGLTDIRPLSLKFFSPLLVLCFAPVVVIAIAPHPDRTIGLTILLLAQALTYLLASCAVIVRHVAANANRRRQHPDEAATTTLVTWEAGGSAVAATLATVLCAASLLSGKLLGAF